MSVGRIKDTDLCWWAGGTEGHNDAFVAVTCQNHQMTNFKHLQFIMCQFYFNKTVEDIPKSDQRRKSHIFLLGMEDKLQYILLSS